MVYSQLHKSVIRGIYKLFGLDSPFSSKNYGYNWTKQKKKCLERDEYRCRICEKTKEEIGNNPDVHHIRPRANFKTKNWGKINSLENLISLCPSCHGQFEGKFINSNPDEFVRKAVQQKE